jgi:transcription initiation factor TFIIIB Brf1 subunit/transcription initiation factor TFIIB
MQLAFCARVDVNVNMHYRRARVNGVLIKELSCRSLTAAAAFVAAAACQVNYALHNILLT